MMKSAQNNGARKGLRSVKNLAALCVCALALLCGCDMFNVSVPEYLDEYTNNAAGVSWEFRTTWLSGPESKARVIGPGSAENPSIIEVTLRNPRKYNLEVGVQLYDTSEGAFISCEPETAHAEYKPHDTVLLYINKAELGKKYRFRLTLSDGLRNFTSYDLPEIKCNTPPEPAESLDVSSATGSTGEIPSASWTMITDGDHEDVCRVELRFQEAGTDYGNKVFTLDSGVWSCKGEDLGYEDPSCLWSADFPMAISSLYDIDNYHFAVILYDDDGFSSIAATAGFSLDTSPDVSILTADDGDTGRVRVTLSAIDGSLKADSIWYKTGDGSWNLYSSPFSVDSGKLVTAYSKKSGYLDSGKISRVCISYGSVYVNPEYTGTPDGNTGWFRENPVRTVGEAIDVWNAFYAASPGETAQAVIVLLNDVTAGNTAAEANALTEITDFDGPRLC
ncbi:hypothetical protein K7I13_05705 [Brucepastera parasyntrophica]|uniref:hypothetical protein n=1 Tax=Brucepastera parasyntrophica TaxID=2880008 RepID=UPI00210C3A93|nr:hypothetical protein [Brucepastera parasyntrophica]ULQ60763.1 hypothetical protein K7I13_05705 [Brucepastera parasyntrophica]